MYEKMNNSAAFQAWTLLFTDDIYKTWDTEINEDLRPLSMLMCSIKHEMKKIQNNLDISVLKLHSQHKFANSNKTTESSMTNEDVLSETPVYQNSPVFLFNCSSVQTTDSPSLVISDEDMANTGILGDNLSTSPEIKKKKRFNFSKRHRQSGNSRTPSPNILKGLINDHNMQKISKSETIIDDASSIDILKQFNTNPKSHNVNSCLRTESNSTPDKNSTDLDDFDNSSIVQCTPTNTKLFRSRRKDKSSHLKGKTKELRSLTLKNMVLDKVYEKRSVTKNGSVDHFKGSDTGLTELVNCVNDNISSKIPCKENLVPGSQTSRCQSMEARVSDAAPEQNLNAILARAHKVIQPPIEQRVVRGKARKNLPGWSCKECEKFYLNQGLDTEEVVALSKCSRHRGYAPREDTNPGFWDMNMSTEDTEMKEK